MSLKAFHIVFITFSILLALGCGGWCVWVDITTDSSVYLAGAIVSFVAAFVLFIYGLWFFRKMKRLRIFT